MTQPEKRISIGSCTASVFANTMNGPNGSFTKQTVTLQKFYKDKEGNDQYTNSYDLNDLFKLELAIKKAIEYVLFEKKEV